MLGVLTYLFYLLSKPNIPIVKQFALQRYYKKCTYASKVVNIYQQTNRNISTFAAEINFPPPLKLVYCILLQVKLAETHRNPQCILRMLYLCSGFEKKRTKIIEN